MQNAPWAAQVVNSNGVWCPFRFEKQQHLLMDRVVAALVHQVRELTAKQKELLRLLPHESVVRRTRKIAVALILPEKVLKRLPELLRNDQADLFFFRVPGFYNGHSVCKLQRK